MTGEIRRGRQYETDQIEMSHGAWMSRLTVADLPPSVTCPRCGMTSFNENDVEQGYCGNCHDWTTPRWYA